MKLIQKQFLKGSREFEIDGDTLFVRIQSLFKEDKLTVDLTLLNPEPVVEGTEMTFYSDFKGRPVVSFWLNKPDTDTFAAFIDAMKHNIGGVDQAVEVTEIEVEITEEVKEEALNRNMYEAPPEFAEYTTADEKFVYKTVNPARLEDDIKMLKTYLDENEIKDLIDSLEALLSEPTSEEAFEKMLIAFNELGFHQGGVLTYAHYIKVLVSDSIGAMEKLGADSYKGVKGN